MPETAAPSWNTPALYMTVLTDVLAAAAFVAATFFHTALDRTAVAPLIPAVATLAAGLVSFVYVHGVHRVQAAHVEGVHATDAARAYAAASGTAVPVVSSH